MRTTLGWLGLVAVSFLVVGCSGGGGDRDLGPRDVPPVEEDEGTAVTDLGPQDADSGTDAPDIVEPTDPGPQEVSFACQRDKDCEKVPVLLDDCQVKVCDPDTDQCVAGWDPTCKLDEGTVLLTQNFELDLTGWKIEDPNLDDQVTWSVSQARKAFGANSLYFGDPACRTYFNGAMDPDCEPLDPNGKDATSVRASVTSPWIEVPDTANTFVLGWYAWVDSEPLWDVSDPLFQQPDDFRAWVVVSGTQDTLDTVFTSVDIEKTTNGLFLHFTADLTEYAGERIAIRFTFDSLDGNSNRYEGVYIDNVTLKASQAGSCSPAATCTADGEICTDDLCQTFTNNPSSGICSFPEKPACEEPDCTEANAAQKCAVDDPCKTPKCVEGQCTWEDKPEGECCRTETLLDAGFEDGTDFALWAYQNNPNVRWQVHGKRAATGTKALYYGDTVKGTYDSGAMNFGFATTPALDVPATGYTFLSFQLWLSTEFDTVDPAKYFNPLGTDFFQVEIVQNLGLAGETAEAVWSSNNLYGTTGGEFLPVGVDLSSWAGKRVWVRFRFDTGDAQLNGFEGVYVDDVKIVRDTCVHRDCAGPADCLIDGTCRTGSCADGVCDVTLGENCCSVTADCDDNDDCTTDGCIDHQCENAPVQKPGCCVPLQLGKWDFDQASNLGQIQFTMTNDSVPGPGGADTYWHISELQSHSPSRALYFGNGANYDNAGLAAGSVTTPTFVVPLEGSIRVSLWLYLDVELDPAKDVFRLDVLDGGVAKPIVTKSAVPADKYRTWFAVPTVDLSEYQGRTISLRMSFNSVDPGSNTGLGVFVDDLYVRKVCP